MLKSWLMSPFHSASEATTRQPKMAYAERVTVAASSGRPRQRPENAMATHHRPTNKATHSANCPSSVMESISSFRDGLVARAAFGEHVGGADDAVAAEPAFHHDLDVVGVSERVGHEAVVGDRVGLHPVRHLEVDGPMGVVSADRAGHHPGAHLEPDVLHERGIGGGL